MVILRECKIIKNETKKINLELTLSLSHVTPEHFPKSSLLANSLFRCRGDKIAHINYRREEEKYISAMLWDLCMQFTLNLLST